MGKKRNNSKVKALKKISSAYGVSVVNETIARNSRVKGKTAMACGKVMLMKRKVTASQRDPMNRKHSNLTQSKCPLDSIPIIHSSRTHNEHDEFHRLHASLEERSVMLQIQKDHLKRVKERRDQWNELGRNNQHIQLKSKTTEQIVDDAVTHMAEWKSDLGKPIPITFSSMNNYLTPDNNRSVTVPNTAGKVHGFDQKFECLIKPQNNLNRFAALEGESDSDNECNSELVSSHLPRFICQPASFSIISADKSSFDDIDDDL